MALAYHCDRDGCDSWQYARAANLWLVLSNADGRRPSYFCTLDCVTIWAAAHSEPTEEVS